MTRLELESACQELLAAGKETISLRMAGDPSAKRIRLLGHRTGPYGRVIGWAGNDVIAKFDVETVRAYLDELPVAVLSGNDLVGAVKVP